MLGDQWALLILANWSVGPGGESKVQGFWLELLECPFPQSTDPAKGRERCSKSESRKWAAAKTFIAALFPGVLVCYKTMTRDTVFHAPEREFSTLSTNSRNLRSAMPSGRWLLEEGEDSLSWQKIQKSPPLVFCCLPLPLPHHSNSAYLVTDGERA